MMLTSLVRLMFLTIFSVGARESWWEMIPEGFSSFFTVLI